MSRPFSIPPFEDEDDFRVWYLQRPTAEDHLLALREWRMRQSKMVSSLGQIIGHFGGEQYTEVDHFLLELLQNADDNAYDQDTTPGMAITLEATRCVFSCNEKGFTPENVFAVCYAAASTKLRDPGKRSFIGEKGIGFKSLFAVAEAVEIHSGDYHFELRDNEYIVPHLLVGDPQPGSRIVVRFKSTMEGIANLLSKRLAILAQDADHFVLFLQRLEKLTVTDRIAGTETSVEILRDGDRCVVQMGNAVRTYRMVSETIQFPEDIVRDRFRHLTGPLERDVRFAVPYPKEVELNSEPGLLFCFLPTRVASGFPFHIQLDGKTTTNRENIESSARSKWNRHLLSHLPEVITQLFLKLRDDPHFRDDLPLYLPDSKFLQTGNDDLKLVLTGLVTSLRDQPLALDRKKVFRPVASLSSAPQNLATWVETDQYGCHLGEECEFLHPDWRRHSGILAQYGCGILVAHKLAELFVKGGCPTPLVSANDESLPREFLEKWIDLRPSAEWEITKLKAAPIYPLKDGQNRRWGAITDKTLLVSLDGREVPVPEGSAIFDPAFTYSPGGNVREEVRAFNERFRTYLTGVLKLKRYSDAQYLEDVLIPSIKAECERSVTDAESRNHHTERWIELFNRIWWRQKTIIGDSSLDRLNEMLRRIGECKIVTKVEGQEGWITVPLKDAFLPEIWWSDRSLAFAFRSAGASMISLSLQEIYHNNTLRHSRSDAKFDIEEWKQFLTACGARQGPRLISTEFPQRGDLPPEVIALRNECEKIHSNQRSKTITTTDFDSITCRLLVTPEPGESLTVAISHLWPEISKEATTIRWFYRTPHTRWIANNAARCRISSQLVISSDLGMVSPTSAALGSENNRAICSGLVPLVNTTRYGNDDFLKYLGVSERIDESWLEKRVHAAVALPDDSEFVLQAGIVMRIAARLAKFRPEGATWMRTAKVFAHGCSRVLLNYDDWLAQKGDLGFPHEVTNEVLEALEFVSEAPAESLMESLFALGDLAGRNADLVAWLKAVGKSLRMGHRNEIAMAFANQLRDRGLVFGAEVVNEPDRLPVIWDVFPYPFSPASFILNPEDASDRTMCEMAAQVLGWPRLSSMAKTPQFVSREEVDLTTRKQLQLTAEVLEKMFARVPGSRPSRSALMRLALDENLTVSRSVGISLDVEDCPECPEVPFWASGRELTFDALHSTLAEAFGSMIDFHAGTTIAPFIEVIFQKQEAAAKKASAKQLNPSPTPPPTPPEPPTEPTNGGGEGGEPSPPPPSAPGVRKRLFSYVVRDGDGKAKPREKNSSGAQAKTDVELAGEKLLMEFCGKHGLGCKDVTAEDKGYDFEVQSKSGLFMVELKSSRDRWQHWENSMTPNEFKSAIQHADDYVLCVAEQVLSENGVLTFIQNPWGLTDGFLFDSPWKNVAVDPAQLFAILEDASGSPPERSDDFLG